MRKHKQLKLALIGCGRHGLTSHAPALARYAGEHPEQVELTAACDVDADRASRACDQFGFAGACEDVAAMIRDHAPSVCICALPGDETLMQGSQLLVQNMPCVFELPLGESLDEAMEMSDAAGEMNTPHVVALNRRTNPYLVRGVKWAEQLGRIESVTCTLATSETPTETWFAANVAHAVDTIGHILGRMEKFTLSTAGEAPVIDLHIADGRTGRIAIAPGTSQRSECYEIAGPGFRAMSTVEAEAGPSLLCWRGEAMEVNIAGEANQPPGAVDGTYDLLAQFISSLCGGTDPSPTIDDALPAVDLTYQIAKAVLQPTS